MVRNSKCKSLEPPLRRETVSQSNTALEGPMRNRSVWWWLATHTVICIPLSYLTFTHDKPCIVTKDNLSQVLTSVVATAVNVISLAENVLSSSTCMRLRIRQRPFSSDLSIGPTRGSLLLVHRCINMPLPAHSVMYELSSPALEASEILRTFLSTRYHTVPLHWWWYADRT